VERDKIDQSVGKACKSRGTSAQDIRDVLPSPEFIKYQGLGLCITRLDRVYHHEGMPSIHIAAYLVRIARPDHTSTPHSTAFMFRLFRSTLHLCFFHFMARSPNPPYSTSFLLGFLPLTYPTKPRSHLREIRQLDIIKGLEGIGVWP
jgi:hypothetical protein